MSALSRIESVAVPLAPTPPLRGSRNASAFRWGVISPIHIADGSPHQNPKADFDSPARGGWESGAWPVLRNNGRGKHD